MRSMAYRWGVLYPAVQDTMVPEPSAVLAIPPSSLEALHLRQPAGLASAVAAVEVALHAIEVDPLVVMWRDALQ